MVKKSALKPKVFEYLRLVEERGEPLIVTDRGRPVVTISPISHQSRSAEGALAGVIKRYERPEEPVDDHTWEATG